MDKKELIEEGKKYGIDNVTDAEFERNSKFTLRTALTRIQNERKGTAAGMKKDRVLTKGRLLGGRDVVTKKNTIETNRGQSVMALTQGEGGKFEFLEVTIWGHLKPDDLKHGQGVEMEIERSKTVTDDDREFENVTLRKATLKDPEIITLKNLIANGVKPGKPDDITEDDLYEPVFVEGKIANVEQVPKFDEGQVVDDWPLTVNGKPCIRLGLVSGEETKVYVQFDPARLSEPFLCFPDFMEVMKEGNLDSAINSLVGRDIAAIGTVRRYKAGEPAFVTVNMTALFSVDEPESKPYPFPREKTEDDDKKEAKAPATPKAPAAPAAPKAPPAPATTHKEPAPATAAPAAAAPAVAQATSKVELIKAQVKEAMELLGTESDPSLADLRELKPELKDVKDALLGAIAKKVKDEMTKK